METSKFDLGRSIPVVRAVPQYRNRPDCSYALGERTRLLCSSYFWLVLQTCRELCLTRREQSRITENLIKATNLSVGDEAFSKRLALQLKRLDGLRTLLAKRLARPLAESTAATLVTRRAREAGTR